MAVRISGTVAEYYEKFQELVRSVKRELIGLDGTSGWYVRLQSATTSWDEFVRVQGGLTRAVNDMNSATLQTGFAEHAKEAENDPAYNVLAEYAPMRDAILNIRDALFNGMPTAQQGGQAYILAQRLTQDGELIDREFTPQQSLPIRNLIDAYRPTVQ